MIWLVGAGPMSIEYARVLTTLDYAFQCITRSNDSAQRFASETGQDARVGGLGQFLASAPKCPDHAIVATGVEALSETTNQLLNYGVKSILVEKPGGLDLDQISKTAALAQRLDAHVYVAYNRRFYETVIAARKLIAEDAGVESFNFEVTEWGHIIGDIRKAPGVKENWFVANTSHVTDLAFFLGGKPRELTCYTAGGTSWHSRSAVFSGAGITTNEALFSYQGNWNAPGRWSLEVLTPVRRLIFRPLEKLQVQNRGSVSIEPVDIPLRFDDVFKPGLYLQTKAFIEGRVENLCSLGNQIENMVLYTRMANY